jgi:Ubiquitin carboxyl-terminal hydrolase
LSEFSFKSVMQSEGHPKELLEHEEVKHLLAIEDDEYIYKLVGVTIHRGTAEHGHYYALINTKRGKEEADEFRPEWSHTENDPWKKFDDETVKYFNFHELKSEAFGGSSGGGIQDTDLSAYYMQSGTANSYGQNAYMLVYEKQKKKPLKEVVVEPKK